MLNEIKIQHKFEDNVCHLKIALQEESTDNATSSLQAKRVENIRNVDVFVEDFTFLMFVDVQLYRFRSLRQFDMKDTKNLIINYCSKTRSYELQLPCLPSTAAQEEELNHKEKSALELKSATTAAKLALHAERDKPLNLWKLKRITDNSQLQIDDNPGLLHFEANFAYGFASQYRGKICCGESDLCIISRVPQPHLSSPIQRSIDREIDELKNFSPEQYKLNFVELQIPEGHADPMKFAINFADNKLTKDEECLLHNYLRKPDDLRLPNNFDQNEIDCGLISMLLAICYDVRSTCNDASCESGWTRSILCPLLTYFEPFDSLRDVVISFLRSSLIYPLYRNYDLSRQCVQDAINALQKNPMWINKQLLLTHELFSISNDSSREVFNRYYLADYIRYINNDSYCTASHLQMLARNLKNVLLDVYKKHLRLELGEIETELLKELITDIHIGNSASEESEGDNDEDDDDDDDDDSNDNDEAETETETETSSASETEENSVIEKRIDSLQI